MSLARGNNTPTRPRIEPGSPDPESDALTTRPVRSPASIVYLSIVLCKQYYILLEWSCLTNFNAFGMGQPRIKADAYHLDFRAGVSCHCSIGRGRCRTMTLTINSFNDVLSEMSRTSSSCNFLIRRDWHNYLYCLFPGWCQWHFEPFGNIT